MELKTLKDIVISGLCATKEEWNKLIKAEAIKWIKEERGKYGFMGIAVNYNQLKRWMERFNITEDDLQ